MAKLQSIEMVGVANRPATICSNTMCIWFDTTNLKTVISYCGYSGAGTWSTGGALITARRSSEGGGTQNEVFIAGGYTNANVSCTEEYNGTSWSAGGALITARWGSAGAGTQNAGLSSGGYCSGINLACTEEYNGTSWSSGAALILARRHLSSGGSQSASFVAGGYVNSHVSCTEEYNKSVTSICLA